ncbi:hypothetical protein DLJ59_07160 [Micromonospora inaquosa]|uniref:Phospholipase n=2 Tax=Micromonospora inaquosa TaxID=2203716 RepID=A0A3N9WXL3_9ACTN|nr:hypothetical protein DLJ59_07160 [Micromonospora inaquosa]
MRIKAGLLAVCTGLSALALSPSGAEAAIERPAVVTVSASPAADLAPAVVKGPKSPHSFPTTVALPAGASLHLARSAGPDRSSAGEVVVRNAEGEVVGAYDAPYALGANGELLAATYRIEGGSLVRSVPVADAAAYPLTVLASGYNPVRVPAASTRTGPSAAVTKVTVPANYVYNPSLGSLHDYCTSSPDSYLAADFRGPCARHDMCYEAPGNNKLNCDNTLYQHLGNNCTFAYPSSSAMRNSCISVAAVYWAAVTAFGDDN